CGNGDPAAARHSGRTRVMTAEARLWLIRHAPVDGPRGVVHGADAPADLTDTQRIDTLRARLPADAAAYCSPARRTVETARAFGHCARVADGRARHAGGKRAALRHRSVVADADRQTRWRLAHRWGQPALNAAKTVTVWLDAVRPARQADGSKDSRRRRWPAR